MKFLIQYLTKLLDFYKRKLGNLWFFPFGKVRINGVLRTLHRPDEAGQNCDYIKPNFTRFDVKLVFSF